MPSETIQLLATLDSSVHFELLPFLTEQGAIYSVGESAYDGYHGPSTLQTKEFSDLQGRFFWWIHRFSFDHAVLDIGYGDREFIVEPTIYYPEIKARFDPWELLLAAEVPDSQVMSGNTFVLSSDFMRRTITSIADGTRKYWQMLCRPEPAIVDRAQELRGRRLIYAQEEQRRQDRERAAIQASRAFHENRLDEAIALLNPFREDADLPRTSKMLLHVAEMRKQ